ncbi:MAG TPA: MerR family DNA-binding transcriptional regulator [Rhodobacteraceae bacterium]|nr:MerR family DNA-binding transcriptional regulator [Paracoccaceae bacterium]
MSDTLMTIRQMVDKYQVTARTLRFYEAKELLSPLREGQKRLFTKRDQARLKLILRGKRFGFALEEIRQLLDLYDMGDQQQTQLRATYAIGQDHLAALKAQRAELDEAISDLTEQLEWGARMLASFEAKDAAE